MRARRVAGLVAAVIGSAALLGGVAALAVSDSGGDQPVYVVTAKYPRFDAGVVGGVWCVEARVLDDAQQRFQRICVPVSQKADYYDRQTVGQPERSWR